MNSTNSLSANSFGSLSQNENFVTTKELANVLGVDVSTVQKTVKRINETSDVLPKFTKGQTPKFNQKQATLIKQEIQKHHNLAKRDIDSVSTEIEVMDNLLKAVNDAIALKDKKIAEQKRLLAEQQPKVEVYDSLVDRTYLKNFRDTAEAIGLKQNDFMDILKSKYIYRTSGGEYRAYAEYQKYFELRAFCYGVDKTGNQLLINVAGYEYFKNKYGTKSKQCEGSLKRMREDYQNENVSKRQITDAMKIAEQSLRGWKSE